MKSLLFILSVFMGTVSLSEWGEIMVLGFLGALAYKLVSYTVSGRKNRFSPQQFDLFYWLSDRGNWNDMVLGCVLFYFIARYKADFMILLPDNPIVLFLSPIINTELFYPVIGFAMTYIIKLIRNWATKSRKRKPEDN